MYFTMHLGCNGIFHDQCFQVYRKFGWWKNFENRLILTELSGAYFSMDHSHADCGTLMRSQLIGSIALFSCGVYYESSSPSHPTSLRHWLSLRPIPRQLAPVMTKSHWIAIFQPTSLTTNDSFAGHTTLCTMPLKADHQLHKSRSVERGICSIAALYLLWPFGVTWRHRSRDHWTCNIWFPIGDSLKPPLYLA